MHQESYPTTRPASSEPAGSKLLAELRKVMIDLRAANRRGNRAPAREVEFLLSRVGGAGARGLRELGVDLTESDAAKFFTIAMALSISTPPPVVNYFAVRVALRRVGFDATAREIEDYFALHGAIRERRAAKKLAPLSALNRKFAGDGR